jgi:hypothetical protein
MNSGLAKLPEKYKGLHKNDTLGGKQNMLIVLVNILRKTTLYSFDMWFCQREFWVFNCSYEHTSPNHTLFF